MAAAIISRNHRSPLLYILLPVICLLGFGLFWFFTNFERKPVEIRENMSPEAFRNPLLAAEHYLQRIGKDAESAEGLDLFDNLPPTDHAIVIRHLPVGLGIKTGDRIMNWVKAGGHLVMVPTTIENLNPDSSTLAKRIGVGYVSDEEDSDCGCPPKTEDQPAQEKSEEKEDQPSEIDNTDEFHPYNRMIKLDLEGYRIDLERHGYRLLKDLKGTASYSIPGSFWKHYTESAAQDLSDHDQFVEENGAWLLRYRIGSGMVTVLSDDQLFTNTEIEKFDHAFFLSHLLGNDTKAWLIFSSNMDDLASILWQAFPLFWVSFLLLLILSLWTAQLRIGPLRDPESGKSRSLLLHIEAIGTFHWRTEQCRRTVEENRRFLLGIWQKKYQGRQTQDSLTAGDVAGLSARTGLSEKQIRTGFLSKHTTEQDFIKTSQILQKCYLAFQGGEIQDNDRRTHG